MAEQTLPNINKNICVLCGLCVDECPENVLALNHNDLIFENPQACTYCGTCEEVCSEGAVRLEYEIRWA